MTRTRRRNTREEKTKEEKDQKQGQQETKATRFMSSNVIGGARDMRYAS